MKTCFEKSRFFLYSPSSLSSLDTFLIIKIKQYPSFVTMLLWMQLKASHQHQPLESIKPNSPTQHLFLKTSKYLPSTHAKSSCMPDNLGID